MNYKEDINLQWSIGGVDIKRDRERHVKSKEGLGIRKMFNYRESAIEFEVTAEA